MPGLPSPETAKISLAKALKVKNRLAGRLAKANQNIQAHNAVLLENKNKVNVEKLLADRQAIVQSLVELKTALYLANQKIQHQLYWLGEKKSEIEFLNGVHVRDGKERHSYQNTEVEYVSFLKQEQIDSQIKRLEAEIDTLQEEVDTYNHTTKIEIRQQVLDLSS